MSPNRFPGRWEDPIPDDGCCAYCERDIQPDVEVFGFGIIARPNVDLPGAGGQFIEMAVEALGKSVPVIVTGEGSPAAEAGFDFYVMTCSEECTRVLKLALERDIAGGSDDG